MNINKYQKIKVFLIFVVVFFGVLGLARFSFAATIPATSCNQADVQAAINSASDGDTVMVPVGDCTWSSTVTIPDTKGLSIIGAGVGNTKITGTANPKFNIHIAAGLSTFTRISGIEFYSADYQAINIQQTTLWGARSSGRYRIDHCKFNNHKGMRISGNAYGVIDNCTFYRDGDGLYGYWFWTEGRTGMTSATANSADTGYQDWSDPLDFGGPYAHYVEDCSFTFTTLSSTQNWMDGRGGGRQVFRHNTVVNGRIGWHDCCASYRRGYLSFEWYDNVFIFEVATGNPLNDGRGATGIIYGNKISFYDYQGPGTPFYWPNPVYRYPTVGGCQIPWDNPCDSATTKFCIKSTAVCTSDAECQSIAGDSCVSVDGQEDSSGYPCRDQFGTAASGTGMVEHPVVAWNNLWCEGSASCTPNQWAYISRSSQDADVVKYERNVIDYDPILGIGTCEDGVDNDLDGGIDNTSDITCQNYWDTINHKKKNYTPYTYPHPLRAEAAPPDTTPPAPPTGVIVQ
jgi:hypothetical protein